MHTKTDRQDTYKPANKYKDIDKYTHHQMQRRVGSALA